jgi:hypothetical protein
MISHKPRTWIKEGVLGHLCPEMRRAKRALQLYYYRNDLDFYITSKEEGNHTAGSCHYEGAALDFKRQGMTKQHIRIALEVDGLNPDDFDIIEYDHANGDFFHVEWDPKN